MEALKVAAPPQRVRLEFHGPDFDKGVLQRTWLLVPSSAREVNDLAWLICDKFKLKKEWQAGIILEMDGFALPMSESIAILRDNDVITIKKGATLKRRREFPTPAPAKPNVNGRAAKSPEKKKLRKMDEMETEAEAAVVQPKQKRKEKPKGKEEEKEKEKKEEEEKAKEMEQEKEESSSSEEEDEEASSSSSGEEEESSSESSSSSSSEEEESSDEKEKETAQNGKQATTSSTGEAAKEKVSAQPTPTKPSSVEPVTPVTKGHVRFGADGQPQSQQQQATPSPQAKQQPPPHHPPPSHQPPQEQFRWNYGRGRGRGFQQGPPPPPPPGGYGGGPLPPHPMGRGRGRGGFETGGGRGRGRGWGPAPGGYNQPFTPPPYPGGFSPPMHDGPGLLPSPAPESAAGPPPQAWGSDLAYAAGFAGQPSAAQASPFAAGHHQQHRISNGGGDGYDDRRTHHPQQQQQQQQGSSPAPPVLYSASLDWKKDTHPSYSSPPPLEPPKDYSKCQSFPIADRNPRRGDVIAYQILEMKDGGPSYSAHKEATIESYDTATSVVSLRANNLSAVPLDGSYVASEEDRAALFQTSLNLSWEQLADVRLVVV